MLRDGESLKSPVISTRFAVDNLMDVFKKARASTNVSLALITGRCVIHAEIRGGVDRIVNGTVLHCFASR